MCGNSGNDDLNPQNGKDRASVHTRVWTHLWPSRTVRHDTYLNETKVISA
jgi:hypothetical protein